MKKLKEPDTLDFLLAQVSHLHHTRVHQLLEDLGLYRGQPPVLFALWEKEGLTQSDLAARMENTPATISKMLQRMEKAGFVTRRPDPNDQRISRVYLTDHGRDIQAQVETIWEMMESQTFAGLDDAQRLALRQSLLRIRQNLKALVRE